MAKTAIQNVATGKMIGSFGQAIVETQSALNHHSIKMSRLMTSPEHALELPFPSGSQRKTLFELGFSPTFMHIQEARFSLKLSFSYTEEASFEKKKSKARANLFRRNPVAQAHNAEYACRYQMRSDSASKISTQIKPVPLPTALEERLRRLNRK